MTDYTVVCQQCGITFQRSRTNPKQRFCSRPCVFAFSRSRGKHTVKMHTLICEGCGKTFTNRHIRQRYCSHACDGQRFKVNKTRICEQCGVTFERSDTNTKQRMCSLQCVAAYNSARAEGVIYPRIPCETCGELFDVVYKNKRYCSRKCYGASMRTRIHLAKCIQDIATAKPPSKPELKMREALISLGILFFPQYPFYWYSIDFFLPKLNIALEVDGVYWHTQREYQIHDKRRDTYMIAKGLRVVRVTDTEINNANDLVSLVRERLK